MAHRIHTEPPFGLPHGWVVAIDRVYQAPWEWQYEGYDVVVQVLAEGRISQARVVRDRTDRPYFCHACTPAQEGRAFTVCEHIEAVYALKDYVVWAPPSLEDFVRRAMRDE